LTSSRYPLLFSPMRLGPVVVANRVVFAAHLTNYAGEGLPTAQHAAYYEARAAGGTGLVITEEHSTHETDWPYEKMIHGFRPEVVDGYRRITEAVHRHGTPIFAQINHNGGQGSGMYSRLPVWSASPLADPMFREVAKAVDEQEIAEIVAGYANVAARCAEGGFDGLELQCSHSSIVRCFLSRVTNRRSDRYGGALANRARLLLQILAAVREAVGRRIAVGVRLCGDELIEGGITIDETVEVARLVEGTDQCDYVNTSIGVATASLYMIEASMAVPPGYSLFVPSALRKAVELPVVGSGRFKDPLQAERALREGHLDLVAVVRGQIADPEFAAKARAGAAEEIRLCLSCNQECVGRVGQNRWLGCIENPATGREERRHRSRGSARTAGPPARRAMSARGGDVRLRVLVAGAGPAGLQSAISVASRRHDVTVCEREAEAGGQIRLAAFAPFRSELGDLVRNQLAECRRLGIEVRTGVTVDAALVTGGSSPAPDLVVVATGAAPAPPWWAPAATSPGDGGREDVTDRRPGLPPLLDVREVLGGGAEVSGRVLVVDELGFHQATSVAELLADRGCQVELMTPGMVSGQDLGTTLDLETWWMRASARGIVQTTDTIVTGVVAGGVTARHLPTGREEERRLDFVVLAVQQAPCDELYFELKELARLGNGPPVRRVGDCLAPRRAHAAVVDGERIGALLEHLRPYRRVDAAANGGSVVGVAR
jgi:2,4-dienoyl-CoA reductase (NADPH2)